MTPEQFCYWLQGWLEMENPSTISEFRVKMIKEHLQSVFTNKPKLPSMESLEKARKVFNKRYTPAGIIC